MAPTSRLEEKLRKLGLSTDDCGVDTTSAGKAKHTFRIYFPMPPYDGLQFQALRAGPGFNFTGQLLGIGGKQLQQIKQESSARVEVVNARGNLNGAHPDPLDPDLHALITADSLVKLQKAADMVCELLEPVNAKFAPVKVAPGGSVRLAVAQARKPSPVKLANGSSVQVATAQSVVSSATVKSCPAAEALRSASVSPMLTPVTPAATANQIRPFAAADGIHSRGTSELNCGDTHQAEEGPDCGWLHPNSCEPSERMVAGSRQDANPTVAAAEVVPGSRHCEPADPQQAETAAHAGDLQPATPGLHQKMSAIGSHAGQQCCRCSGLSTCCCAPVPSSTSKHPDVLAVKSHNQGTQNHTAVVAPSPGNSTSGIQGEQPSVTLLPEEKPGHSASDLGHRFPYGLGLCSSSSWDSHLSCSSRDSPALRALIADHHRQQQEGQIQLMQAQAEAGIPLSVCNTPSQASRFDVGCLPADDFSLGPAALPGPTGAAMQADGGCPLAELHLMEPLPAGFIEFPPVDSVTSNSCRFVQPPSCGQQIGNTLMKCWQGTSAEPYRSCGWDCPAGVNPAAASTHSYNHPHLDEYGCWPASIHQGAHPQAGMDHGMQEVFGNPAAWSAHTDAQQAWSWTEQQQQQQRMLGAWREQRGMNSVFCDSGKPGMLHAVFGSIW